MGGAAVAVRVDEFGYRLGTRTEHRRPTTLPFTVGGSPFAQAVASPSTLGRARIVEGLVGYQLASEKCRYLC